MSYLTTCAGFLEVVPAVPVQAVGPSRFLGHGDSDAIYITRMLEGCKYITGIEARTDEPSKLYNLHEDINAAVKEIQEAGAEVDGELVEIGEDWWDINRYVITGIGYVSKQRAIMRWPDGTKVEILDEEFAH